MDDDLAAMRAAEFARRADMARSTISRLMDRGDIPELLPRIGRSRRIPRKWATAWLNGHRTFPTALQELT